MNRFQTETLALSFRRLRTVVLAHRRAIARFGVIAACSMLFAMAATTVVGTMWNRDMRQPRITLLGAGDQLSVLVTAGEARVLFVAGNDPKAFATALARARPPTTRRLDVLLIDGDASVLVPPNEQVVAASRAVARLGGPPPAAPEPDAPANLGAALQTPRRIRLPGDVSITVEAAPSAEARNHVVRAWRATIVHGGTTIVLVSDGAIAERFAPNARVSALIVVGRRPDLALRTVAAPLVAFSAEVMSGNELRRQSRATTPKTEWALRVFPGEAVRLDLIDGGLRFAARDAQPFPQPAAMASPFAVR